MNRKVRELCALNRVQLYEYANVGNHLHLLIRPRSRLAYQRFIRGVTGVLARLVLSVERGPARVCRLGEDLDQSFEGKRKRIWDVKPWTRIIECGRDFRTASRYVRRNLLQASSLAYRQAFGRVIPLLSRSG